MNCKRFGAAALIAVILLPALAACSSDTGDVPETTDTTVPAVTDTTTYSRENTPDSLPDTLNFNGMRMRFPLRDEPRYIREITGGDTYGDVVTDAVADRNRMVEERLGIKIETSILPYSLDDWGKSFQNSVLSLSDDYDIVPGLQTKVLVPALAGCFYNLQDEKYIDLEQPWWWNAYIDELRINNKGTYFLNGDISLVSFEMMSAIIFNKQMLTDLGTTPEELYDTVLNGKWTYDRLSELGASAYRDVNGDGVRDRGDIYGYCFVTNTTSDHFAFTVGLRSAERDANGHPVLTMNTEAWVNYFQDVLHPLFYENDGTLITGTDGNLRNNKFLNNTSLFLVDRMYVYSILRDYEGEYGVIPYPKLTEAQENYETLVHDATTVYCVPITASKENMDGITATLEAMCAQSFRTVVPAFYEIALKVKYQSDSQSGQCIDLIRAGIHTEFGYAYSAMLSGVGALSRWIISSTSTNFASQWARVENSVDIKLAELIRIYEEAE